MSSCDADAPMLPVLPSNEMRFGRPPSPGAGMPEGVSTFPGQHEPTDDEARTRLAAAVAVGIRTVAGMAIIQLEKASKGELFYKRLNT